MTTPPLPAHLRPATSPLDQSGVLASLASKPAAATPIASNVPATPSPNRVLRDTLLSAMANLPVGMTCGDCDRCYTMRDDARHGNCSAFPPVSFMLDGKLTSRDPIVSFSRPACTLFRALPDDE